MSSPAYTGKLADPEFRTERARKAALARTDPDYYLDKLEEHVKRAADHVPPLTEQQRARLAELLRPRSSGQPHRR